MVLRWISACAVVMFVAGLAGCSSAHDSVTIHETSMENTFHNGQSVNFSSVESNPQYTPAVGDVVEFELFDDWGLPNVQVAVARVIATGGETVRGIDGKVQVSTDGGNTYRTLSEPYVFLDGPDVAATFGPITVPQYSLWVMGDHRNDREGIDSRYHCRRNVVDTSGLFGCDPSVSTVATVSVIAYRRS